GGAIVDSITSSTIGAGLSLNYLRANERRRDFESWDARLAVAGTIKDIFFIGATGRYLRVEDDLESGDRGPNGRPALPSSGSQQMDGLTFDAGAGLRLANIISIGVAGYNLTNPGSAYAPLNIQGIITSNRRHWFARASTFHIAHLQRVIREAVERPGFAFVEVMAFCIENFGRRLGFKSGHEMLTALKTGYKPKAGPDGVLGEHELGVMKNDG
ncbi:MAG: hypothetical protein HGA94_04710, partial [Candidatus Aminicenantes bacterium]|nr:hypothetical protein [Candidatus Aminicenantes bacterium]